MSVEQDIVDSIGIVVKKAMEQNTQIYQCRVIAVNGKRCTIDMNGRELDVGYYGSTPAIGSTYPVFVPSGNYNVAFAVIGYTKPDDQYINTTMTSSGWSNKQYSFESSYPSSKYNVTVSVASTATSAQYDTFSKAKIVGNADSNIITALGTVPTSNIPVMLKVVAK